MAIAFVQQASNSTSGNVTTLSASYGSNQTAGNMNILAIGSGTTAVAISNITDQASNSYTLAKSYDDGGTLVISVYYCASIASHTGANQVTVTWASTVTGATLGVLEYSGLATSSPTDGTAQGDDNINGTPATPTAVTTTNATDLVIGAVMGDSGHAFTAGTGYTSRTSNYGSFPVGNVEDQITTSTGSFNGNFTCASQHWALICCAFKTGASNILRPQPPFGNVNVTPVNVTARLQGWTVRQTSLNNLAGGGLNVFTNFAQPVVAGNLIVVAVNDHNGNTFASASDSVGTSYAVATSQIVSGASFYVLYGNAAAAGTNSVGVNFNGVILNPNIWALEIQGSTTSLPLDVVASANGVGTAVNSGSLTTTTNNDFLFGYLYSVSGMTSGETGWTQTLDTTSGTLMEYRAPLVSGTFSATGTSASSSTWVALEASFLPGAGASGPFRPQPPFGNINLSPVVVTPRLPNLLRITLAPPFKVASSGGVTTHTALRPGPFTGTMLGSGVVHGTIRIANQFFVTATVLQPRTVIRTGPISATNVSRVTSVLTPRYTGTLREQITGSIGASTNTNVTPRFNPLRIGPLSTTPISLAPVTVSPKFGGPIRVTLPHGTTVVTNAVGLQFELSLLPAFFAPPPYLIRTFLGAAPRTVQRLGPLPSGATVLTSGIIAAHTIRIFPGNRGTVTAYSNALNPRYTGALRQVITGTINTSGLPSLGRLFGPQEIPLPPGLVHVTGLIANNLFTVPRIGPEPATGLCVIGSTATWYDNETEVSTIFFESAPDPSFLVISSSTAVPWMPAPVFRSLLVPFADRFYRVRTVNNFGTSYSNISDQTPAPAGPITVSAYGYYVILDIVGADLIMELHPGIDYAYVVQSIIAGPFPDYVSALNQQALINI